ncbi:MAG TPA: hypothetical protein PKK20_06620 [Verrucomicrobiota bacterium]|jgi:hypothetical protein|nr:hypothetical protein [Verrucomicrobiota bacterium]OQC63587.1 MAG: hypothetical protein BWX48_03147 [Verrucomicrobia bacterium ADurb.Bin006]HNU99594.1 hypothetical protein [Verrucomicrobiota bacterium]HOA60437.1 hypothetical protein [Verrucomicrobiota bacterium]HOF47791.1 hypothetical protein [Verrucomicrobiota bacterium]
MESISAAIRGSPIAGEEHSDRCVRTAIGAKAYPKPSEDITLIED